MKKRIICTLLLLCLLLSGCTEQTVAKNWGGTMTLNLEPGQKLEEITWKDNQMWYLTRPMKEDEEPETHTFQESSEWGIIEGTVIIIEYKEE